MNKIKTTSVFAFFISFLLLLSCNNDDDNLVSVNEKDIQESKATSEFLNSLNINFNTTNVLNEVNSPWDSRPIHKIKGQAYRTKSNLVSGNYSFVFHPDMALKYGIAPGTYLCEFWTVSALVDLPNNLLAARAIYTPNSGYLSFEPHNNKETLGVRYSTLTNNGNNSLSMSTNYFVIASNVLGQKINKTIPNQSLKDNNYEFSYQYITW